MQRQKNPHRIEGLYKKEKDSAMEMLEIKYSEAEMVWYPVQVPKLKSFTQRTLSA